MASTVASVSPVPVLALTVNFNALASTSGTVLRPAMDIKAPAHPDGLPNASGTGIEDAFRLEYLFAPRLTTGVGRVDDTHRQPLHLRLHGGGDVS